MDIKLFDEAFASLPALIRGSKPSCALMLGSGWSAAVEGLNVLAEVPYTDVPNFGDVTVIGHSGRLALLELPSGGTAIAFFGRRHWYEGASWEAIVMPAEISRRLGVPIFLITNASGGIRRNLNVGDVVIIKDHIRMNHLSPLAGPHVAEFGPRFPDQTHVYTPELIEMLKAAGKEAGFDLTTGVYAFSAGPSYETPAEIRAYEILGADLVGMSTVPEAMFASSCGMKVAGLAFVSNMASGLAGVNLSGTDVIDCAERNTAKMSAVLKSVLAKL